jgi:uncharacterized SAM-binding protein YcdF (DUF218 family)
MPAPSSPPDVLLILGGGLSASGELPPWSAVRFDKAIELAGPDTFFVPLSAGTPHKAPIISDKGFPLFESIKEAQYLLAKGIDPTKILIELASYDTIGNAYFSRTIHVDPAGFRSLTVITSEFHLERTKLIFDHVYRLPPLPNAEYQLTYVATPNVGLEENVLAARAEREQQSIQILRQVIAQTPTLSDFHRWLFQKHGAYTANQNAASEKLDPLVLASY